MPLNRGWSTLAVNHSSEIGTRRNSGRKVWATLAQSLYKVAERARGIRKGKGTKLNPGQGPASRFIMHPSPITVYFTDSPTNAAGESRHRRIQMLHTPSNCALKRELYAPRVMLRRDFLRIPRGSSSIPHKTHGAQYRSLLERGGRIFQGLDLLGHPRSPPETREILNCRAETRRKSISTHSRRVPRLRISKKHAV